MLRLKIPISKMVLSRVLPSGLLYLAFLAYRPVQDDYSTLFLIQKYGYFGFLEYMWNNHGGNLTPLVINGAVLYPAKSNPNFISLHFFALLTLILIFIASICLIKMLELKSVVFRSLDVGAIYGALVIIGMGGFFTPGLVGAFAFSSASLVHLWPICLLIIGLFLSRSPRKVLLLPLFFSAFIAGNSNIAESLCGITVCLYFIIFSGKDRSFSSLFIRNRLFVLLSGLGIGSLVIVLSPGFWIRAASQNDVGMPDDVFSLLLRLSKATAYIFGDVLTHPINFTFFFLGVAFFQFFIRVFLIQVGLIFMSVLFFSLTGSLIIGAALGYPAWHQTLGTLLLAPIFFLFLGARLGGKAGIFFGPLIGRNIAIVFAVISLCLFLTASIKINQRGMMWDENLVKNSCLLKLYGLEPKLGPEIKGLVFGFGVEDIATWPWMQVAYRGWLEESEFYRDLDCKGDWIGDSQGTLSQ